MIETDSYIDKKTAFILPKLIEIVDVKVSERKKIVTALASSTMNDMKERFTYIDESTGKPKNSGIRTKITKLGNSLVLNRIKYIESVDASKEIDGRLKRCIEWFRKDLNLMYRPDSDRINAEQTERRERVRKKTNRIKVQPTEALTEASRVLTLVANEEKVKWQDVAFALLLTTGRRSVEIMRTARFTKVDDYSVSFEGYAKQKDSSFIKDGGYYHFEKEAFTIPTLVKSDLVIAGLQWLIDEGRRVSDSADNNAEEIALRAKVNGRYSKAFTNHFKSKPIWDCLPDYDWIIDKLKLDPSKKHNDYKMSAHTFRAIYLRCCVSNEDVDAYDYLDYAQSVLGDAGKEAVQSYQKFELEDNATTRI